MFTVGLTGGIGSGKSIVTEMFAALGAGIVDTDAIAHQLVQPDAPCFDIIIDHFGHEVLHPDGNLNRSFLREIIFQNVDEKTWLEELLHPLIRDEVKKQIETLTAPYCIIVIPLLTETYTTGSYAYLDRILLVDCEVEQQIERAMARDSLTQESAQAIVDAQATRETRLKIADDVIVNNKHIDPVREQVEKLHHSYLEEAIAS